MSENLVLVSNAEIYNYKELHICKVQEDGTSVMFTIQTK